MFRVLLGHFIRLVVFRSSVHIVHLLVVAHVVVFVSSCCFELPWSCTWLGYTSSIVYPDCIKDRRLHYVWYKFVQRISSHIHVSPSMLTSSFWRWVVGLNVLSCTLTAPLMDLDPRQLPRCVFAYQTTCVHHLRWLRFYLVPSGNLACWCYTPAGFGPNTVVVQYNELILHTWDNSWAT